MDSKKWVPIMVAVTVMVMAYEFRGSNGFTMCNMKDEGLMACYPSVRTTDPVNPTKDCCNAVQTADLVCLCSYKNSVQLPLLGINPFLAVTLPYRCNIKIPVGWKGC